MAASLEPRTFGRTGLEVTTLGYGAMEIRGPRIWRGRDLTDDQAEHILNTVLDAGINFIDTAYDYGRSEEYIGRFISHGATSITSPRSAGAPSSTPATMTRPRTYGHARISPRGWRSRCAG